MVAPPQPNCLQLFKQKNRAFYTTGPWSTLRSMEHKVKFKAIEQPDMFQITCRLIPGRWQTNSQTKNLGFFFDEDTFRYHLHFMFGSDSLS